MNPRYQIRHLYTTWHVVEVAPDGTARIIRGYKTLLGATKKATKLNSESLKAAKHEK